MEPLLKPQNRSLNSTGIPPWRNAVNGVACVMTSTARSGSTYPPAAILSANAIITKARPTIAGLKMFMPSPPKTILPIPTATKDAMIPMYQGAGAGSDSPRITPVTAAERSHSASGRWRMRVNSASPTRQAARQITICFAADQRNK